LRGARGISGFRLLPRQRESSLSIESLDRFA
jgi:hypothetical protein